MISGFQTEMDDGLAIRALLLKVSNSKVNRADAAKSPGDMPVDCVYLTTGGEYPVRNRHMIPFFRQASTPET